MSDDHDERRRRDEQQRFVPATHTQSDAVAPGQVSRSGQLRRRANPEPSPFVAAMRSIASETSLQREAPPVADPTPSTPVQLRSAEPRPRDDGAGEVDDHLRAAMGLARPPPAADAPKAAESESLVPSDGDAMPPLEKLAPHGVPALATGAASDDQVHEAAQRGVAGAGSALPHGDAIQRAFGRHDISGAQAHVGGEAATASRAIGAEAYATGDHVAFAAAPSLHTTGHEAAHVVQQRGGVQLKGGVGESGDAYEQHANQVADAVVQGKSAEALLDRYSGGVSGREVVSSGVQRFESHEHAELGDQVHSAVGVTSAATDPEKQRLSNDKFTDGDRSLSLDLRARNPATGLPTADGPKNLSVSYGEMIALSGDFYYSVDNLRQAPFQEVSAIRDLIAAERRNPKGQNFDADYEAATTWRRDGVYQPGGGKEGTKGQYWGVQPGDAAHDDAATYVDLATENNAHFSAATGAVAVPDGPEGNAARDNHQGFLSDHSRAIAIAKRVRELKKQTGLIAGGPPAPASAPAAGTDAVSGTPAATAGRAPTTGPVSSGTPTSAARDGAGATKLPAGADSDDLAALENLAYVYNAGGDHYLTDAFSAGHLINKALLAPITDRVLNSGMFDSMVESLMPYAMREPAVLGLSPNQLGIGGGILAGGGVGLLVGGPVGAVVGAGLGGAGGYKGIQKMVRGRLREGLSVFKTDANLKHNVGAKLVHDYLNTHGATVVSKNGRFRYTTKGDGTMDATTKDIVSRAVLASRNYIRALMNDSDAELGQPQNADDAWEYTPNVDVTLLTSRAEPMMRLKLSDTAQLWELMKIAVKVKETRKEQDKTEAATAKVAQTDKGGDWGRQPNPRFTRRMIVTNNSSHQ